MKRISRSRDEAVAEEPAEENINDDEGGWIDPRESPADREEGETEQQAGDRIEAKYKARATSPLRAIRAFCVICVGCYPREVAKCTATNCALHPFRYGTNPFQKRKAK